MTTVLTMGTFDLIHPGHVELLAACRLMAGPGGKVIVAVNSDEFVAQFKPAPPVQTYDERATMIQSLIYVDAVTQTTQHDAKPTLLSYKPDFLVIGSDWAPPRDYFAQLDITPEFLRTNGISLMFHYREGLYSSTSLKERVRGNQA